MPSLATVATQAVPTATPALETLRSDLPHSVPLVREAAPVYGAAAPCSGGADPCSDAADPCSDVADPFSDVADPFRDDADALDDLEERIVVLAAHLHAAEYRFLRLVAEFDRRGGWKRAGHRDCADWLQFNTGLHRSTAREKVRVARALERMPLTSRSMARGELSFSKVRALARLVDEVGRPEEDLERSLEEIDRSLQEDPVAGEDALTEASDTPEAQLLEYAGTCTTAELERLVRSWRLVNSVDEQELERRRHASRYLSIAPDGDGMYVLRARVDPEVGALVTRAVEAASDALFHAGEDWAPEGGRRGPVAREVSPRQRRADALGLLAERALAAGFGGIGDGKRDVGGDQENGRDGGSGDTGPGGNGAEGDVSGKGEAGEDPACTCDHHPRPRLSGTRAERYQVVLHVDEDTLRKDGQGGRSHLEDGTRVSAETARRLSCDAGVVRALRGSDGSVLDIGRRTRTIPPALRRALEIRDGGCRFPGCGLRFTEGHHIIHWEFGGETRLSNLVLLCRRHHRAVHEEGFRIRRRDGRTQFFDRVGWPLPDSPPLSRVGPDAVQRLIDENRKRGVAPDWTTPAATYKRADDIPHDLHARTWEVLDPA